MHRTAVSQPFHILVAETVPGPGLLRPGVVVVQLPVEHLDELPRRLNNKFGTMSGMVNNRKAQLRNRGDSGKF